MLFRDRTTWRTMEELAEDAEAGDGLRHLLPQPGGIRPSLPPGIPGPSHPLRLGHQDVGEDLKRSCHGHPLLSPGQQRWRDAVRGGIEQGEANQSPDRGRRAPLAPLGVRPPGGGRGGPGGVEGGAGEAVADRGIDRRQAKRMNGDSNRSESPRCLAQSLLAGRAADSLSPEQTSNSGYDRKDRMACCDPGGIVESKQHASICPLRGKGGPPGGS